MDRRRLPVGIQTFREIREEGCYYVDKTPYARRLADDAGKHYFLSRPRRFGKSLFVDTLKELYEGAEGLFRGLAVHDGWDWSRCHPVVRLSFGAGNFKRPDELRASALRQLDAAERRAAPGPLGRLLDAVRGRPPQPSGDDSAPGRFAALLETLHRRTGRRVVVLVDEYDKPILDALDEPERAKANRDDLRGLYGTLKDCDAHVELSFITGVSRFSKVSLFSGLNNLVDLTLDPDYSAICGYTDADLDRVFAPELPGLDRDEIRAWYDGYGWLGEEKVYNPFGLLKLFRSRRFEAHWFETGTPRFLVDTLIRRGVAASDLDDVHASEALLSEFDVDAIAPEALLFQTGYLTIRGEDRRGGRTVYRLGYPNREVRQGLGESLLDRLAPDPRRERHAARLYDVLASGDATGVEAPLRALLAGIPHDWHRSPPIVAFGSAGRPTSPARSLHRSTAQTPRNEIARYEGYWASVFYAHFAALGLDVAAEDATSRGRLDLAVRLGTHVYLFELKVAEPSANVRATGARGSSPARPGAALAQLKERGYADKYRAPGCVIHLIGVEIGAESRDIVAFETELA